MRSICLNLLVITLFACESNTKTSTQEKGKPDASLETNNKEERLENHTAKGAERFKGEYQDSTNERITTSIRDYPGKEDMLAFTLKIGSKEPGTIGFRYDEEQDMLSSKKTDEQRNFSTLQLDDSGNRLTEIHYDWKNNTSDTTIYLRTQ
jgi:hypothetical protein